MDKQDESLLNSDSDEMYYEDDNYQQPCFGKMLSILGNVFGCICTTFCCGRCCYPYKTVHKGNKGVIKKFGQIINEVNDGLYYVNPVSEDLTIVNIKIQEIRLHKQTVITRDNISVKIDGVVYFKVIDVQKAIYGVDNIKCAVSDLSLATLRNIVGTYTLQECLERRNELAETIQNIVFKQSQKWGIVINSIQIIDIELPDNIKTLIASAALAQRESESKIILAQADVKAAELMKQSADILNSEAAMQIRYLETINRLTMSPNTKTIVMSANAKPTIAL